MIGRSTQCSGWWGGYDQARSPCLSVTLIALTFLALFTCSVATAAEPPTRPPTPIPLLDPSALKTYIAAHPNAQIIDVRPASKYQAWHVPGSMNLPLHTIKAMGYLKSRPLILMNEGHEADSLSAEARNLWQLGFQDLSVAELGARGSQSRSGSGARTPSLPLSPTIAELTPQQWSQAQAAGAQRWVVIEPTPAANDSADWVQRLRDAVKSKPEAKRAMILTSEGYGHTEIEAEFGRIGGLIQPVFFVEGGMKAYQSYVERQVGMTHRREGRMTERTLVKFGNVSGAQTIGGGCCGGRR